MIDNRAERVALMKALREIRDGRHLVCYVTSTRVGVGAQMATDVFRPFYDHLREIPKGEPLDLFVVSHGGAGTVPWRLANLLRDRCGAFDVLIPHEAYSAATLLSLGADAVVMHPMGVLGPIDPQLTVHQDGRETLAMAVEDVWSYISLVRDDVGIRHEDELVQAFKVLAENVPPQILGSIKRSHAQGRMLGSQLLELSGKYEPHETESVVEHLSSKLFDHSHPIGRVEAQKAGLKHVVEADDATAAAMWNLYEAYERDLQLRTPHNPVDVLFQQQHVVPPQHGQPPALFQADIALDAACIESESRLDRAIVRRKASMALDSNGQAQVNEMPTGFGWEAVTS